MNPVPLETTAGTSPPAIDHEAAVQAVVDFFENLQPHDLDGIARLYAADARFKDPFNEVQGVPAIQAIFRHMFEQLETPRFQVTERVWQGDRCFLVWDFHFALRRWRPGTPQVIRGASLLVLAPDGRVQWHRDYWDAAEELYEKLPVIGGLMRWLRQRART